MNIIVFGFDQDLYPTINQYEQEVLKLRSKCVQEAYDEEGIGGTFDDMYAEFLSEIEFKNVSLYVVTGFQDNSQHIVAVLE